MGLFIFTPPFRGIPFGTDKICWFLSIGFLIWNRRIAFGLVRDLALFRILFVGLGLALVHVAILLFNGELSRYGLTSGSWTLAYLDASKYIFIVPFWWSFFALSQRLELDFSELFDVFLIVLLLWAASTVFLIFMPQLNYYIMREILRFEDVGAKVIKIRNRGFGLTQGHLYEYGIVLSFLWALVSWNSLYRRFYLNWFVILAPLLAISYAYNARIAFVTSISALLIVVFKAGAWHLRIFITLLILIFVGVVFILMGYLIPGFNDVVQWLARAYRDLFGGVDHYEVSTIEVLRLMWHVPSGLGFFVGHGIYLPVSNLFTRSDIGYVIQLYYGGFFYVAIMIAAHFLIVPWNRLWRLNMFREVFLISVILGAMFIANIKGGAFTSVAIAKVYFLAVFMVYLHPKFTHS